MKISAKTGRNIDTLIKNIYKNLPDGDLLYPEDIVTEETMRDVTEEIIREKILLNTSDEIPHSVAVKIESYTESDDIDRIYATIYCETKSQKGILIGKGGNLLKKIGMEARKDLENIVLQDAILPQGLSKEEALVKVEKDLKTFFFDNKTKINSMNMDTFYALSDNILRKYNIIPNNTQLNLNKAKISAKNSFEDLVESFFDKKYGDKNWEDSSKAEMVAAITSAAKDMAEIGIKLQSANTIQETKNLTQMSTKEAMNFLRNKNMLKTNSEEYLTYKMKQNMPGPKIKEEEILEKIKE